MEIFDFTAQDLAMNRSGLISERQMIELRTDLTFQTKLYGVLWGLTLIGILFFIARSYNSSLRYGQFQIAVDVFLIVMMLAAFILPVIFIIFCLQVRAILTQGRVKSIDGKFEFKRAGLKNKPVNFIRVSKKDFLYIDENTILRLKKYVQQDADYRLYYTPYRKKILAAEKLDQQSEYIQP
jgi:hypothetical protein